MPEKCECGRELEQFPGGDPYSVYCPNCINEGKGLLNGFRGGKVKMENKIETMLKELFKNPHTVREGMLAQMVEQFYMRGKEIMSTDGQTINDIQRMRKNLSVAIEYAESKAELFFGKSK